MTGNSARRRPSPAELSRRYERVKSVPAVAEQLGVAYETARHWLLEAGIELRNRGRPSAAAERLDAEELTKRYKSGESIATIGAALGVSPTTVRKRLIDAGVSLRARRGWKY